MSSQKYEKYWSCTLEHTDFYGNKFNQYLRIIVNFIDNNSQTAYSEQKYKSLQMEIKSVFNKNPISIRKAINQFVKLGFIDNALGSYHRDVPSFLIANNREKKKTLFSKIVYSNSSLDNSVTDHSQRKEINFLLKTLHEVRELDKSDILALMTTDITTVTQGFLTRVELDEAKRFVNNIDFLARKYNQVGHFWRVLDNLDGLHIEDDRLWLEQDATDLGLNTEDAGLSKDPYLCRIFRNQLVEESKEKYGSALEKCMLSGVWTPELVASHIKPFKLCNPEEAYDSNNGLLLTPDNDALFDGRWIAFENDGSIILSSKLQTEEQTEARTKLCNYSLNQIFLNTGRIKYLEYNREYRLIK